MFKKLNEVGNITLIDNKSLKELKKKFIKNYSKFESYVDLVFPKKAKIQVGRPKVEDKSEIICINDEILFFKYWSRVVPSLKLAHKFPGILKEIQVDKGAIKHVLGGADIMAPGLTSEGGNLTDVEKDEFVIIKAEGKEIPLGIGLMLNSSEEIKSNPTGIAVRNLNYIGDGLWFLRSLKK